MTRDPMALIAYLDARAGMPFAWGRRANDCVSFAAGAVIAQTGRDPLPDVDWTSERGALRVLKRTGGLEAMVNRCLRRTSPALAMRGDVAGVIDPGPIGLRLMIVEGAMLVGPGDSGLDRQPRAVMSIAWSAAR